MNREFLKSLPAKPDMMIFLGTKLIAKMVKMVSRFYNFILRVRSKYLFIAKFYKSNYGLLVEKKRKKLNLEIIVRNIT